MQLPCIIAEVAQGYEGKPEYCELYVEAAAKAGATAIKFQIVYADEVALPGYQHYEFFKTLEMDVAVWKRISELAHQSGLLLFCDVSGYAALNVAREAGVDGIKIHSSNFFNRDLIRDASQCCKTLLVSLGGIEDDEIVELAKSIEDWGSDADVILLSGFQAEPTPIANAAIARIPLLKQQFPKYQIGFMDHVDGESSDTIGVSAMAMALGASVIEKHLTLSRFLEIEDYMSALEPREFSEYVVALRRLASAMEIESLDLTDEERAYRDRSVKKVIAKTALSAGHVVTKADVELKRSAQIGVGDGYHNPAFVVGRRLLSSVAASEGILSSTLE